MFFQLQRPWHVNVQLITQLQKSLLRDHNSSGGTLHEVRLEQRKGIPVRNVCPTVNKKSSAECRYEICVSWAGHGLQYPVGEHAVKTMAYTSRYTPDHRAKNKSNICTNTSTSDIKILTSFLFRSTLTPVTQQHSLCACDIKIYTTRPRTTTQPN